ncbi:hypothetical protein D3C79_1014170 [compost metagenome]
MSRVGEADPPQHIALKELISRSFFSCSCRAPIQMVGTPAVNVTFSCSIKSIINAEVNCGPGRTCVAPTLTLAKGNPHAFA